MNFLASTLAYSFRYATVSIFLEDFINNNRRKDLAWRTNYKEFGFWVVMLVYLDTIFTKS
jgi:hypothetical protein